MFGSLLRVYLLRPPYLDLARKSRTSVQDQDGSLLQTHVCDTLHSHNLTFVWHIPGTNSRVWHFTFTQTHVCDTLQSHKLTRPTPNHMQTLATLVHKRVCCSVLQCVADYYSVLQCIKVCCSVIFLILYRVYVCMLQSVAVCFSEFQCVAVCCSVLQCVAVCCRVLLCAAVSCSVLGCETTLLEFERGCNALPQTATRPQRSATATLHETHDITCVAVCCSTLQCIAVCCSVLQCAAVCCSELHLVAVCCSVLQYAAVCCNVLQCVAVHCSFLQCVTACCSVLLCVQIPWYYVRGMTHPLLIFAEDHELTRPTPHHVQTLASLFHKSHYACAMTHSILNSNFATGSRTHSPHTIPRANSCNIPRTPLHRDPSIGVGGWLIDVEGARRVGRLYICIYMCIHVCIYICTNTNVFERSGVY